MALSVFAAFRDRYQTLSGVFPLYLFDAPVSAENAQVYPSYCVLTDEGLRTSYEMEHTVLEVTDVSLMLYGDTLDAVDAAVEAIKYGGGGIADGQGMDFCALTLDTDYANMEVKRTLEQRFLAQATGKSSQRVFGCRMEYRVSLYRVAA